MFPESYIVRRFLRDLCSSQAWWLGWAVLSHVFTVLFYLFLLSTIPVFVVVFLTLVVPIPHIVLVLRIMGGVIGLAVLILIIPLIAMAVRHTVLTREDWEMIAKRLEVSWYGLDEED